MKRSIAALVAVMVTIPIAVLGYGYWFGQTHGALLVSVEDVSDREHLNRTGIVGERIR